MLYYITLIMTASSLMVSPLPVTSNMLIFLTKARFPLLKSVQALAHACVF